MTNSTSSSSSATAQTTQPAANFWATKYPRSTPQANYARVSGPIFPILITLFAAVMIISMIAATKGVTLFPSIHLDLGPLKLDGIPTDGAFYIFPLAYILGDIISEIYGFRVMRYVVLAGLVVMLLAAGCFWLTMKLPAASWYAGQESFKEVAVAVPLIFLASLAGFVFGEVMNSWVLVRLKEKHKERNLVVRLISSSVVGEFFDTIIFCSIAAQVIGITTFSGFLSFTIVGFVWKTLVEIAVMPITYLVVTFIKKLEPSYSAS